MTAGPAGPAEPEEEPVPRDPYLAQLQRQIAVCAQKREDVATAVEALEDGTLERFREHLRDSLAPPDSHRGALAEAPSGTWLPGDDDPDDPVTHSSALRLSHARRRRELQQSHARRRQRVPQRPSPPKTQRPHRTTTELPPLERYLRPTVASTGGVDPASIPAPKPVVLPRLPLPPGVRSPQSPRSPGSPSSPRPDTADSSLRGAPEVPPFELGNHVAGAVTARVQMLRDDPALWEHFHEATERMVYERQSARRAAYLERQEQLIAAHAEARRRLEDAPCVDERQRIAVSHRRRLMAAADERFRVASQRTAERTVKAAEHASRKFTWARQQRKWLTVAALALTTLGLVAAPGVMLGKRRRHTRALLQCCMLLHWRRHAWLRMKRRRTLLVAAQANITVAPTARAVRHYTPRADIVRRFLKDIHDSQVFVYAVRRHIARTSTAQRIIRSWHKARRLWQAAVLASWTRVTRERIVLQHRHATADPDGPGPDVPGGAASMSCSWRGGADGPSPVALLAAAVDALERQRWDAGVDASRAARDKVVAVVPVAVRRAIVQALTSRVAHQYNRRVTLWAERQKAAAEARRGAGPASFEASDGEDDIADLSVAAFASADFSNPKAAAENAKVRAAARGRLDVRPVRPLLADRVTMRRLLATVEPIVARELRRQERDDSSVVSEPTLELQRRLDAAPSSPFDRRGTMLSTTSASTCGSERQQETEADRREARRLLDILTSGDIDPAQLSAPASPPAPSAPTSPLSPPTPLIAPHPVLEAARHVLRDVFRGHLDTGFVSRFAESY